MADADREQRVVRAVDTGLRLGGGARPASSGRTFGVDDPSTGETLARQRSEILRRAFELLTERADDLALLMTLEMGKSVTESRAEIGPGQRDEVAELVDEEVARGATVRVGGTVPDGPGSFSPPTVLADVPADAALFHQEIVGPVAPIQTFTDDDAVIRAANDTEYGLVSFVYTRDLGRAIGFSEELESGMVGVNRGIVSNPAAPFGGVKQSGLGREGGDLGIDEYLETTYVALSI